MAVAMLSVATQAAFITPTFRGEANTTYQAWNEFVTPEGPNAPDVALSNPNGTPDAVDLSGASFVTSGGNIYVQGGLLQLKATIPDYALGNAAKTNVVVQVRTLGSIIDTDTVLWNGVAFDHATLLVDTPLVGGFGGVIQEWAFEWDNLPGNFSLNTLLITGADLSVSLDRLSVDTQAVPVPEVSSLGLLAACSVLLGVGCSARRYRRTAIQKA